MDWREVHRPGGSTECVRRFCVDCTNRVPGITQVEFEKLGCNEIEQADIVVVDKPA